jgi:hypothetical protein
MIQALIKLLTLSSFIVAGISYAEVFDKLNYSGRIVNSDGSPRTGPIELEVNFYNSITSDTSVSSIDYSNVELTNGTFSLAIDVSSDRDSIFNPSNETWIEITDKTNNQTYPRQKLEAVPYAHEAGGLAGHPIPSDQPGNGEVMKWDSTSSSWVWGSTGGAIDPTNITAGAITETKIATAAVTRAKIANAAVGSDEIATGAVDTSELATSSVTNDKLAGSIADTKLLTITTSGKVANSATTAKATSGAGTIVARDGSGDFSANEITATTFVGSLTGNAASATTAANVSGTVALANGGTGAGDAAAARTNLGLGALATKNSISAAELSNDSVSLSKLDSAACADDQVIKKTDGVWTCTSISLLTARRTENRLVYVNDHSVKVRELYGETMTVKMSDGKFYNGVTPEITLDISDSSNLYTGTEAPVTEAPGTWYYVYAVPTSPTASTFKLTASVSSPSDGNPFGTPFKYLGAFYNDDADDIVQFIQKSNNEFLFAGELNETFGGSVVAKTNLLLKYIPKTALSVTLKAKVRRGNASGISTISTYSLNETLDCSTAANHNWAQTITTCELLIKSSNPQTIQYAVTGTQIYDFHIRTSGYVDDLGSY